jgi:Rrf2 family transcriptional regulator, cysteine metabolism repressor
MIVSTRSRYGLYIMYELALKYGEQPVFLGDIAKMHGISAKYLSKLVIPLRGAGLITSFRGAHGGYALARAPRAITMREIVQVLEGDVFPAAAKRRETSPTEGVWVMLEKTISDTLQSVTLESIVETGRQQTLNYQI